MLFHFVGDNAVGVKLGKHCGLTLYDTQNVYLVGFSGKLGKHLGITERASSYGNGKRSVCNQSVVLSLSTYVAVGNNGYTHINQLRQQRKIRIAGIHLLARTEVYSDKIRTAVATHLGKVHGKTVVGHA